MLINISDYSVKAIRESSINLIESLENIENANESLKYIYEISINNIGGYEEIIGYFYDKMVSTINEAKAPTNVIADKLNQIADIYYKMIYDNPFEDL